MAYDAASLSPTLIGTNNQGVPNFLTTLLDTEIIQALFSPMTAADLVGETKKGDFTTLTAAFMQTEAKARISTYGDYNANGSAGVNVNYPQRQSYHFQVWSTWGERELEMAGAGRIALAAEIDYAATLGLAKFTNATYLKGVSGLQNYGLMNDPNLPSPVAASAGWAAAEPQDIYNAFNAMFKTLVGQTQGRVLSDSMMRCGVPPTVMADLNRINLYGLSAMMKIKEVFTGLEFVSIPEFDTDSGRLVQLWAPEIERQRSATCGFTEKLRNHAIERYSSYFRKKSSAGSWGAIIFRPACVTQLLGV
jgi:hypothetical protein